MPVDTSFYNSAPPKPVNPLEMMSQMQGIQGQQLRNQLMQRTMGAQQAVGRIAQSSLRPDGTTDLAAYQQGIAGGGDAVAFGAQDAANNAQSQATQQQALTQAQLGMHVQRLGLIQQTAGSLADKPGVSSSDVSDAIGQLVTHGIIDPKEAASELATVPTDPSLIPGWARQQQMRAAGVQQQITAMHQPTLVDSGSQITEQNVAPLAPTIAPVVKTLSPGEAASPVAGPANPDGSPTTVTLGQRANMGTVTTGQGPAQISAQSTSGGLAAQGEAAFSQQRRQATQNAANFSLLRGDMTQMFTGAGTESKLALVKAAQAVGININADQITTTESAAKVLQQIINAQPNAGSSDKQLMSTITANPHLGLSKDGLALMAGVAEGNNNAMLVAGKVWDKAKSRTGDSSKFNDAMPAITQALDPKAFQYMAVQPSLRHFITDGMSAEQKAKLHDTLTQGNAQGWFK